LKSKSRHFSRNIRAVSPVIAVLLMIVIAVAAGLFAYAWTMGYLDFLSGRVNEGVQIQSISREGSTLSIYAQNVGSSPVTLTNVYVNDGLDPAAVIENPNLNPGETTKITSGLYDGGTQVTVKVVTADGNIFQMKKAFTGTLDVAVPTIGGVTVNPGQDHIGAAFEITAEVTDLSGVQSVVAQIQRPDETNVATVPLTGTGTYTGTWDSSSASGGTYYVDIVATDTSDNIAESDNAATIGLTTTTTLLSDGFEEKWESTPWDRQTDQKHGGAYSINSDSNNQGYLTSFSINAQGATSISISFWYRHTNIADSDFEIYLYNSGGSWINTADLGDDGGNNNWYHYAYSTTSSSYRHSQFKLRFRTRNLGSGENVWVDDVQVTVTGGPGTVFADNFELADPAWNSNWLSTNWDPSSTAHSASVVSAWSSNGNEGSFTSANLDASLAESITIDFWLMLDDTETADLTLRLYDGSSYDDVETLGTFGTHDNWLHYSHTTTDSQYFKSNFRIQLFTNIGSGENVWIDDVQITIETIPP
jgi:FlaG/FlaF family flagellin (archaellin)